MSVDLLPEDEAHFLQRKAQIAAELQRGRDLSPKGSLDAPILDLIDFLNSLSQFYTTSSCSGRISIFQHRLSKTKGGQWLLINHDPCEWSHFTTALSQIQTQPAGGAFNDAAGDVVLRFEPFILAVECRTLAAANQLLSVAMACGFRESGLSAAQKRFILSVRSSVRLEVPLWSAKHAKMLVDESYIRYLLDLANEKYAKNIAKIARFFEGVRVEFGGLTLPTANGATKKFYNAFEAAASAKGDATATASSTAGKSKPKLTPHALFNRQERVLVGAEALEQRLLEVEANLRRVRAGEPIVPTSTPKGKKKNGGGSVVPHAKEKQTCCAPHATMATTTTTATKAAAPAATPAAATAAAAPASVAPTGPLTDVLFVPRAHTKLVKDSCTARRWVAVQHKIVPATLPASVLAQLQAEGTLLLPTHLLDSAAWMRIPLEQAAGEEVRATMRKEATVEAQRHALLKVLEIASPAADEVLVYHAQVTLAAPNTNNSATAAANTKSTAADGALSPTAPPRVCLLHFLRPLLVGAGLDPTLFESRLPSRWEKLGDDLLIFPASSFRPDDGWEPLLRADEAAGEVAPLWRAVLDAFKGVMRVGIAHEVATADVLRTSQVRMVVTGEEREHPNRAQVVSREEHARGGWVTHRENGVLYRFDTTRVMFSSGNGTEKARIVDQVRNENIAERFGETEGETMVDLYAGIGYFTMPLLVHTAVINPTATTTASTTTTTASSSSKSSPATGVTQPKLRFLHACEWNPHSLDALARNMVLNRVAPERFEIHGGDNRRPELVERLRCVADRVSLGLLPSAEDAYGTALKVLKSRGGVLHVHANVPDHAHDTFRATLEAALLTHLRDDDELRADAIKSTWTVRGFRTTLVKNYAPRVGHVVFDVACFAPNSPWWLRQREHEEKGTAAAATNKDGKNKPSRKTVTTPASNDATGASTAASAPLAGASSDPSRWHAFANDVPVVHAPSFDEFRAIVARQEPVVLRGVDLGSEWRTAFTPDSLQALASRAPTSSASNPLVTVHVSPQSSRMDFLQRNYMFKQIKFKEMIERMVRIGRGAPDSNSTTTEKTEASTTPRSPEAPALATTTTAAAKKGASVITRDSYFISPHELYYLRALGGNPKTEVADFTQSFPELSKRFTRPRVRAATSSSASSSSASTSDEWVNLLDPSKIFSTIFRVASPGLQLWTHYDITDNLLVHLHGLKRVVLFPPSHAVGLGLKPEPDSSSSPVLDIDAKATSSSAMPSAWPAAQAAGRQLILLPGDVLFIPALWFHNVTSLQTKYAAEYEPIVRAPLAASTTAATSDDPYSAASLRACGDICVGLNLFWRELDDGMYQAKDLYGNKDLVGGVRVLTQASSIAADLAAMPPQYAEFYGLRARDIVRTAQQTR